MKICGQCGDQFESLSDLYDHKRDDCILREQPTGYREEKVEVPVSCTCYTNSVCETHEGDAW